MYCRLGNCTCTFATRCIVYTCAPFHKQLYMYMCPTLVYVVVLWVDEVGVFLFLRFYFFSHTRFPYTHTYMYTYGLKVKGYVHIELGI